MIDPFAEVRQLEWSQRLARAPAQRARRSTQAPVGQTLWRAAAQGGAQALAQPTGAIAPGMRADLVVLDPRRAGARGAADRARARRGDFRPVPAARARRDVRRPLDRPRRPSCTRTGRIPAIPRRPRALRHRAPRRHESTACRVMRTAPGPAVMATFDMLLTNVRLATMREAEGYGVDSRRGARHPRRRDRLGRRRARPAARRCAPRTTIDARRRWATPGLVDCHTHLVYARQSRGRVRARGSKARRTRKSPRQAAASTRRCARRARRATRRSPRQARRGSRR